MYCPHCGNQVQDGVVFCGACGKKLTAAATPPPLNSSYQNIGSAPYAAPADLMQRPGIVTALAILNYFVAGLYALGSIGLFLTGAKETAGSGTTLGLGAAFLLLAILAAVCAYGLWTLKPLGRRMQIIFACFGLLGFPIGTIISILILVYLFKPEIKILFSGKMPEELSQPEINLLSRYAASSSGAAVAVIIAVVLIGVIAFTGIIAAIAIPNLLNAIQRGKQKRSMADMRAIGTACEAYAVDNDAYPDANTVADLEKFLAPKYIRQLPKADAWEHEFRYRPMDPADAGPQQYIIVSAGKDGVLEYENLEGYTKRTTQDFNNDIVFSNGTFVQYPEMTQR